MSYPELESRVRAFFDEFVEAFRSFNGNTIAQRYLVPYLAFHNHSSARVFLSSAETGEYFQRIIDEYHAKGCRLCRYENLAVVPIGKECALATVTWELLAENQGVISAWQESYNLCLVEGRFMVFTSTDHAS